MMKLFVVLVMLTACCATPQDLTGKMFTFPEESSKAFIKLSTSGDDFSALSVCLRFFTDLSREHSLFSVATPSLANAFVIWKIAADGQIQLYVKNTVAKYDGFDYKLNAWNTICSTWESNTGLSQLWLNGNPGARKITKTGNISGKPIVILGQEQDNYGMGFDKYQSFVGMISDVHAWNYVISPCDIERYATYLNFTPGNEMNWKALEYEASGNVLLENKQQKCANPFA